MLDTCFSTAPSLTTSRSAMALLLRPSAINDRTSRSRGVSCGERVRATARKQLLHHLGVEHGTAGGHPLQRIGQVVQGRDPVLEQVADAALAVGEQILRVCLLDVLRQHQHCRPGSPPARLECSQETFGRIRRWHPHVDDRDVGLVRLDRRDERVSVTDRLYHLAAGLDQQPDQTFAQ